MSKAVKFGSQDGQGQKWPSQEEWDQIRPLFTYLYVQEGRTLGEIRKLFAVGHGFQASERMYKSRIRTWHLDKNNKEDEMRAIVAMAQELHLAGKRSRFRIRGRTIQPTEVERYFNRKGVANLWKVATASSKLRASSDLDSSTVETSREQVNSDFAEKIDRSLLADGELESLQRNNARSATILSSICPTLSVPAEFRHMEFLLVSARDYFDPSSAEFVDTVVPGDLMYSLELQLFERGAHIAAGYADIADWEMAIKCSDRALTRVPGILRGGQSLNFLVCVFLMLGCCEDTERSAFITALLRFVSQIATLTFSPTHPFCQMIHALIDECPHVSDLIELGLQKAADMLQAENLAFDPRTRITAYGSSEILFSRGKFSQARSLLQKSWEREEVLLGKPNAMAICSMMAIAKCDVLQGDYVQAEMFVSTAILRMCMVVDKGDRCRLRTPVLVHVESCKQLQKHSGLLGRLVKGFLDALDHAKVPSRPFYIEPGLNIDHTQLRVLIQHAPKRKIKRH